MADMLAGIQSFFSNPINIGFILAVIILFFIIFKRYISALILDYVIDGGLSFLDEFFGGALMFDWGDWIAAIIIFIKERKISGSRVAAIVAIEAATFIPGIDYITNIFPAVTISRILFNKFRPAEARKEFLNNRMSIAEEFGISIKEEKRMLQNIDMLLRTEDPVDALIKEAELDKSISKKLISKVSDVISDSESMINNISQERLDVLPDVAETIQNTLVEASSMVSDARKNLDEGNIEKAITLASGAKEMVIAVLQSFSL